MKPELQRRVQRYGWDRAEPVYDRGWAEQLAPAQQRLLALAALRPGESVLDVACGTGLVTLPAARAVGTGGFVLATDISDAMVRRTAEEAKARGLNHVAVARVGAEELDVQEGAFHVALCALGLMYLPDPVRSLELMRRAVCPGGRVVAAVWGERSACGWAEIFPIVDRRVNSDVCPLFFGLGTGEALTLAFADAGLEDVTAERFRVVLRYDSSEAALAAAFVGGPVALAHSRFDDATRDAAYAEYLESIAAYRSGDGYEIPGEFVVAHGRRPAGG